MESFTLSSSLLLPFIPLFVAFDVLGILPIFVSFTAEMNAEERSRVVRQSILTAFLVSLGFVVAGDSVFALLGISVSDFQIAGGALLFVIAIVDNEFTLKELGMERGGFVLKPHNPAYPVIRPRGELEIFGVMVGLVRRYSR